MSETKNEWKLPKNIRQVGDGDGEKKLYVEDYVVTYLNQLSEQKDTARGLLLGMVKEQNLYPYIFVDAAIEIEDFQMNEEEKAQLQKRIEKEFGIRKTVGWFFSSKENPVMYNQEVLDIYRQQFPEENQVLLVADPMEEELAAFFLEDDILTEQTGYNIYYEKNIPMQNMLIRKKEETSEEAAEEVKDDAIHHFRKMIHSKKQEKEAQQEERNNWLSYIASGFLIMTILALGVTLIYSYDRMKQVEQSLAALSDHVESQKEYVTDQVMPAEEVISHLKEESETNSEEMTVEEEIAAGEEVFETAETESERVSEMSADTDDPTGTEETAEVTDTAGRARASYTVKVGDTLAGISQMYYGSTERIQDICSLNGIAQEDPILPGQKILLP